MVTQDVIKEIYKKYKKLPKDLEELRLTYFIDLLKPHHQLEINDDEVINNGLDTYNPLRRFLMRRLTAILEFDKVVAFVFSKHIIFYDKASSGMHVHFKPEKKSFISRLFGK